MTKISVAVWTLSAFASGILSSAAPASFTGLQPQLAAMGERVYVAFGHEDSISVARSDDRGDTFNVPMRLPLSGRLSLGMHRGPRVAVTSSTVLIAAVAGTKGGGADGDVLLFRSLDLGKSWTEPLVVNDVGGSAREGLHALAASPSGVVVIAWLDLRAPGTRVFAAVSRDHGSTWAPDVLVYESPDGSVCECCHPSVALDQAGRIAVMFRNNLEGNRDMYVVQSTDGGAFGAGRRIGTTAWPLNGCPMDGGGVVFDDEGLTAAWRRDDGIFLSDTTLAERRVGTGRDPAIAMIGSHHDIAWSSSTGVMLMRDSAKAALVAPGRFPAILALADRTILAWEDKGTILLRAIAR